MCLLLNLSMILTFSWQICQYHLKQGKNRGEQKTPICIGGYKLIFNFRTLSTKFIALGGICNVLHENNDLLINYI